VWPPSLSLSSTVHEVHENLFPGMKSGIQICSRGKRKIENPRNQTPSKVSRHKVCSQSRTHRNPQNSVDSPGGSSVRVWAKAVCYNDVRKSKHKIPYRLTGHLMLPNFRWVIIFHLCLNFRKLAIKRFPKMSILRKLLLFVWYEIVSWVSPVIWKHLLSINTTSKQNQFPKCIINVVFKF